MDLYFIKCWTFTNNNNIKTKQELEGKINNYSYCVNYGFKKFGTIDKKELSIYLKASNYTCKNDVIVLFEV